MSKPTVFSKLAKHWAACRRFQRNADRLLYAYGRLLRRIHWSLPARDAVVRIRLHQHQSPFYLRLSSTDWLVLEEIFHQGEYSCVERHLKTASWIVDLGANAGFSVRYWHALYPHARVIAVEPDAGNCQTCEKNLSAAALSEQVQLIRAAVGSRSGHAELLHHGGEWGYQVSLGRTGSGTPVNVFAMPQLLDEHAPGRVIDLLKCDVEGAERELFADCRAWINRVGSIIIELHPPYGVNDLLQDLSRANASFRLVELSTRKACPVAFLRKNQPGATMGAIRQVVAAASGATLQPAENTPT